MNRLSIYAIISLLLLLVSCSQIPNELITAEQLLETAPDSALHILQRINPAQYKNDEHKALYGLLYIHALDNKFLPLKPDSLLDFSIDYYQKHTNKDRLAACYLFKGRSCKAALEYEKAMEYYMKGLDKLQDSKNFKLLGRLNFDLGYINSIQNDYIQARQKYKIAYGYFIKTELKAQAFYSQLNIGRTYHMARDYSSAQRYYHKLFSMPVDSLEQGALLQEIALNYYDSKQPDSALIYYRRLIHYPYIGNNKSIRYNYLANVFFDLNILDSAFIYAKEAFMFKPTIRTQRECYRILANTEYLRGNMKEMSAYMSKYVVLGDSLRKIDAQIKGSYIEWMHTTNREVTKTKYRIWFMGVLLLLVLLTGIAIFYLSNKKHKKHILFHDGQIQQFQSVLELKQNTLVDDLKQKIECEKLKQAAIRKKTALNERDVLVFELYQSTLHLDDWKEFTRLMNYTFNSIICTLEKSYPDIKHEEIICCCLQLLDVPHAEGMIVLNISSGSLYKLKQRLALKLKLSGAKALDEYLKQFKGIRI